MNEGDERAVSAAVGEILAEADREIAGHQPACRGSGRCCRFEQWGHRLYVTGVELMHFGVVEGPARRVEGGGGASGGRRVSLVQFFGQEVAEGCPYQVEGKCTAREGRPLGCRVYFCEEAGGGGGENGWQNALYEKYHEKLQAAHERFGVPYRYMEWRVGLRELMASA